MDTKLVVPACMISVLMASTSTRGADHPEPLLAGYHAATPYYDYPRHVRRLNPRHFGRETIIIDRPVIVERPVVIDQPVEIEQPILVDPYRTYDEPGDEDQDIYTVEEPY